MRKRSITERVDREDRKGKGQSEEEREDCRYATCLVVQAQTTFTLDLQCIQRVQTGFINPLSTTPRTCIPDIYAFPTSCFLDVQPEATRLYTCNRSLARRHCYFFFFFFLFSFFISSLFCFFYLYFFCFLVSFIVCFFYPYSHHLLLLLFSSLFTFLHNQRWILPLLRSICAFLSHEL